MKKINQPKHNEKMPDSEWAGKKTKKRLKKWQSQLKTWLDQWQLSLKGLMLASLNWKFWLVTSTTLLIFGTLMNLLSGGLAPINLLIAVDWPEKWTILGENLVGIFGVGKHFGDWLVMFIIIILQSILMGLVILVWHKRLRGAIKNTEEAQSLGLMAGLAILGTGCPSCGTSLLAPILSTFFSGGGYALAGKLAEILNFAVIILALIMLKRVGLEAYVTIISDKRSKNGRN